MQGASNGIENFAEDGTKIKNALADCGSALIPLTQNVALLDASSPHRYLYFSFAFPMVFPTGRVLLIQSGIEILPKILPIKKKTSSIFLKTFECFKISLPACNVDFFNQFQ